MMLRQRMGKAGRDRAQARFSLDAMLDGMEKVFYQALRTHSALT
ncbi:MAG: glycosyltransferase [Sulfuricella sp.]